jgi:hypothetical protein
MNADHMIETKPEVMLGFLGRGRAPIYMVDTSTEMV